MNAMTTLIESNNAALHGFYSQHGRPNDPGRKLNPLPRHDAKAVKQPAFPDPFAAFDAACSGKTMFVSGYTRKDGRYVAGYYRRPRAKYVGDIKPLWIGTVTDAGTEHAPLLVG